MRAEKEVHGHPVRLLWHCLAIVFLPFVVVGDIPSIAGGGNFTNGSTSTGKMSAMQTIGARAIRINLYPVHYWNKAAKEANQDQITDQMLLLHEYGINPVVILFEYYGNYSVERDAPRDSVTWYKIGRGFADKWRPNSEFLTSKNIKDWGITVYQAINEPDHAKTLPTSDYVAMLKGLAAGVHSVDPDLKVIPGGFMSENALSRHKLEGYGTAIAPLLNSGALDGIDLHTYNDARYAPIEKLETGEWFWGFSPQADFDAVKEACGITRDINFYATEYGFKNHTQGITDDYCAKRTLSCIWANLAVTKNDGKTPATGFALIWNLFQPDSSSRTYGLARTVEPEWEGNAAGKTFQMVMQLTKGMSFHKLNHPTKGVFVLTGQGKKMWVWQNLPEWTTTVSSEFTLTEIPPATSTIAIYRYNSWESAYREIPCTGLTQVHIKDLVENETLMFVAQGSDATGMSGYPRLLTNGNSTTPLTKTLTLHPMDSRNSSGIDQFDLQGRALRGRLYRVEPRPHRRVRGVVIEQRTSRDGSVTFKARIGRNMSHR